MLTTYTRQKRRKNSNDLDSYLESFKREIENIQNIETERIMEDLKEVESEEEDGMYLVDKSGNYYYQATKKSDPVLAECTGEQPNKNDEEIEELAQTIFDESEEKQDQKDEGKKEKVIVKKEYKKSAKKNKLKSIKVEDEKDKMSYVILMNNNTKQDSNEELVPSDENFQFEETTLIREEKVGDLINFNKCNFCDYSSPKRYLLSRHMQSHSEEKHYKCSICERDFKTQASLQNHINTHMGYKPNKCRFCTSCFTTSGELVRHVRYKHTHEKPHKCKECEYASVELSKLRRHMRSHTGERPYQCPHCTYAFSDNFKLKRHLRTHTGEKPYECDICHARFTQLNSMKSHKLIHTVGDKPVFQCELCPATCGRKTDLRIHVQKLHTSDQPIRCRRCNQLFPDRYNYKVHSKTHDGEKCFKCEFCPYASFSQSYVDSHMLIHTNQKPFHCPECSYSFRRKQLLKRHINLYHNESYVPPQSKPKTQQCPDCDKLFSHKGNLIRHMAIHDPDPSAQVMSHKVRRQNNVEIVDNDEKEIDEYVVQSEQRVKNMINVRDNSTIVLKKEKQNDFVIENEDESEQYVVLEVVQVDDQTSSETLTEINDREKQQMIDNDYFLTVEDFTNDKSFKKETSEDENSQDQAEIEICFGFDDDMENELDEQINTDENKSMITLLHI